MNIFHFYEMESELSIYLHEFWLIRIGIYAYFRNLILSRNFFCEVDKCSWKSRFRELVIDAEPLNIQMPQFLISSHSLDMENGAYSWRFSEKSHKTFIRISILTYEFVCDIFIFPPSWNMFPILWKPLWWFLNEKNKAINISTEVEFSMRNIRQKFLR